MDNSIFQWFNRLAQHTSWAHGFFRFYANYGIVLLGLLIVVAYVDAWRTGDLRTEAWSVWAGGAALAGLGLAQLVGGAVDRARPYTTIPGVLVLVDKTTDFSFPSDHATVAGAVAVGLWFANRRWGTVAIVLAVLMAFTRVYVGAHYLGDVLAGLALGGLIALAGRWLVVPALTRIAAWVQGSPLRPLVGPKAAA